MIFVKLGLRVQFFGVVQKTAKLWFHSPNYHTTLVSATSNMPHMILVILWAYKLVEGSWRNGTQPRPRERLFQTRGCRGPAELTLPYGACTHMYVMYIYIYILFIYLYIDIYIYRYIGIYVYTTIGHSKCHICLATLASLGWPKLMERLSSRVHCLWNSRKFLSIADACRVSAAFENDGPSPEKEPKR